MPSIHPTAIVDSSAELGADVEIGPYAVIGADVSIGDRTRIGSHAVLEGPLQMGADNLVCPNSAIGLDPQVNRARGPYGRTIIGNGNTFREFTQVNRSIYEAEATVIGDGSLFMASSHVAHDCKLGNELVLANGVLLAGHVTAQDRVVFGGNAGVHQFARIGRLAMVGGAAALQQDAPPFCTVIGARPAILKGLNILGLRRAEVSSESRTALRQAYRTLFRTHGPIPDRIAAVDQSCAEVKELVAFVEASDRGVTGFGGASGKASRDSGDAEAGSASAVGQRG